MIKCASDTFKRDGCVCVDDWMDGKERGSETRCGQTMAGREVHLLGKRMPPKIEKA